MNTDAFNRIITRLLVHEKRDVTYCNMYVMPEIREARAELAALEAENAAMRGALITLRDDEDMICGVRNFAMAALPSEPRGRS